ENFSIFGLSVFDATDYFVSNILLPLGALMIALFIIHKMDKSLVKSEFMLGNEVPSVVYSVWRFLMTIVLPLVILFVYLNLLGIIKKKDKVQRDYDTGGLKGFQKKKLSKQKENL